MGISDWLVLKCWMMCSLQSVMEAQPVTGRCALQEHVVAAVTWHMSFKDVNGDTLFSKVLPLRNKLGSPGRWPSSHLRSAGLNYPNQAAAGSQADLCQRSRAKRWNRDKRLQRINQNLKIKKLNRCLTETCLSDGQQLLLLVLGKVNLRH